MGRDLRGDSGGQNIIEVINKMTNGPLLVIFP